jgi:hypothetical protein
MRFRPRPWSSPPVRRVLGLKHSEPDYPTPLTSQAALAVSRHPPPGPDRLGAKNEVRPDTLDFEEDAILRRGDGRTVRQRDRSQSGEQRAPAPANFGSHLRG